MKSRWDSAEKVIEAEGLVGRKMIVDRDIFSIWAIYNRKDTRNVIYKIDIRQSRAETLSVVV